MTGHEAEMIAIRALGWLAANDELWPVFLGATGANATDLAALAQDPTFLGAVLDFITAADSTVLAFCAEAGLPNQAPLAARRALPGGAEINWT